MLRAHALSTQAGKSTHSEGAAAFAVLAPRARRQTVVRALVAFQGLYDYLDTLSEQPGADHFLNGCQLHSALVAALDPEAAQPDYYAHNPRRDDGGYLERHVEVCRAACAQLPSYLLVAGAARRAAYRCMVSQGFNHALSDRDGSVSAAAAAEWAQRHVPAAIGLYWWETLGAAGSSLVIYALLAAAADPLLDRAHVRSIERLYFPWAGALHGLLDSLVDLEQDAGSGDHSHVAHYRSAEEAADRLGAIAARTFELAAVLPSGRYHAVILAGMSGYYLATPQASVPIARGAARRVIAEIGPLAQPALLVIELRRQLGASLSG